MNFDPKNLTEQQKQELLRDDNGNDIPDVLEEGKIPQGIGVPMRQPRSAKEVEAQAKLAKFFSKFIRVSYLKKQMEPNSGNSLISPAQFNFRKWLPLFLIIDVIIFLVILYYVFGIRIF